MEDHSNGPGRTRLHALILTSLAMALPVVTVEATMTDRRQINGTLCSDTKIQWISSLPLDLPDRDIDLLRTFPGRTSEGHTVLTALDERCTRFESELPRRFGAIGATRLGTYALGGFHPLPTVDGERISVVWDVTLTLPEGRSGVLGDQVFTGTGYWRGQTDRIAMAAPARMRVTEHMKGQVTVVSKGRPRGILRRHLADLESLIELQRPVMLVVSPQRRKLLRHTQGTLFVSDRYGRLSWPLGAVQEPALAAGLLAADTTIDHPAWRDVIGFVQSRPILTARPWRNGPRIARQLSWIPPVDGLLTSRRMAFYGETFQRTHSTDVVEEDVVQHLQPKRQGADLAHQLERMATDAPSRLVETLDSGASLDDAIHATGLDGEEVHAVAQATGPQDYTLEPGETFAIRRHANPGAAPEWFSYRLDGQTRHHRFAAGEVLTFPRPDRILLDPKRQVDQTTRQGDAYPIGRLAVVASAGISTLNLRRFRLEGSGSVYARGRNDTRNLFFGTLSTGRRTLLAARLGWVHKFGPLRYGIFRRHRVSFSTGPNLTDASFLDPNDGRFAMSAAVSYRWSNQVSAEFPLRGKRFATSVSTGFHPTGVSRWVGWTTSTAAVHAFHPRVAVAGALSGGWAASTRDDRLLSLGGSSRMASLPVLRPCVSPQDTECAAVARTFGLGRMELRVVPLRHLSVPLWGAWATELQVSVGTEFIVADTTEGLGHGTGVTAGVSGVYELFGAEPGLLGVTAGWLLNGHNVRADPDRGLVPEIFLRWTQPY